MSRSETLEPVGGPLWTRPMQVLTALFLAGIAVTLYRFVMGIGAIANLNDGYAWGAWKPISVIVFTSMASGGYATALLLYVFNRRKYAAVSRTAILTSALGYTTGVIVLGIDIGRPWNFWRIVNPGWWNFHSVLLEVAVCISTYIIFLWLEMAHPLLEGAGQSGQWSFRELARRLTPALDSAYPFIVAMAIVLPTMHQSSLGSLFLLAGVRVHPFWQTPLVPLLFLFSCYVMGYAFVVLTSLLSSLAWRRPLEMEALTSLSRVMSSIVAAFVLVRLGDLAWRGQLTRLSVDGWSLLFYAELLLLAVPAVLSFGLDRHASPQKLFLLAASTLLGGSLYRLDTSLVAFMPGAQWRYFPSVLEMLVTIGFAALAVMGYIAIVKRFPILPGVRHAGAHA
ncbi:MAG TPA: Ni/Fe-hydrogenase cytochrome b subunit [Vicinamibacterales bacterium]|nr:Ni/Fe-hydrogenase cytochrome b subunit [Vicinamibacterales bacterium]